MVGAIPRSAMARRRLLERIELLCDCGAGLEAVASPLTHAVRDYLGCASGSVFWVDDAGEPCGFYHDAAPAEIKDLFITRLDELFLAPGQTNMMTVMHHDGPSIGSTLRPGYHEHLWSGNVYRYLCVPLNHRWLLDMRIEVAGRRRAVLCMWQTPERPFAQADVQALAPVQPMVERLVASQRADVAWHTLARGHFVTGRAGTTLISIDADAERMLMASHLLGQQVSMTRAPRAAPGFVLILAELLAAGAPAETNVPVADGRIVARATAMRGVADGEPETLMVTLELQAAADVLIVDRIADLPLTPLQKRIPMFAMRGNARADCGAAFGVSAEALKKHLRAIFDATGTTSWTELPRLAVRSGGG